MDNTSVNYVNYVYDGSFEGLLSAIYEAYYRRQFPQKLLVQKNLQESILDRNIFIETDNEKSKKVIDSVRTKISEESLNRVYHTYLSEYIEAGTWIYEYLRLGWKMGGKIDSHLSDERVLRVHKTSLKVLAESHRMLGLLRFQEIYNGIFYAPMEPDHNIIALIAPHFSRRFADQNWVIHDIRRGVAAIYDKNSLKINTIDFTGSFGKNSTEDSYRKMWKSYFKNIAIKTRINPTLQKRNMPARYWKHLVEKQLD